MNTLPHHFNELLRYINPPENRVSLAKEYPNKVREYLKDCDSVITKDPHTRLAGSYARNTAIGDIKDVDILLFVSEDYRDAGALGAELVLKNLYSALRKLPDELTISGRLDSEEIVLRKQRRSINVHLENQNCSFDLDIVPVTAPSEIEEILYVPDKNWSRWVETQPIGYACELSKLNGMHEGKVIRLIKLFKHWRNVQMAIRRPKSYWLECLIFDLISSNVIETEGKSYAELSVALFKAVNDRFTLYYDTKDRVPKIADPMLKNNVAWNWQRSSFEGFMNRIRESYKWALRALEEKDEKISIENWQQVFGKEFFPSSLENSVLKFSQAAFEGSLHASSTGLISLKDNESNRTIPTHRFYGQNEE